MMSDMSQLWRRYRTQGDLRAREEIISSYAYLAKYVVDRMLLRPNSVIGYDDLIGHAVVGLIDAVEKYDPSRNVKFETYAMARVRGAVLDAVKSLDWMPRSLRASEQEIKRTFADLEASLGRPASDREVAAELGVDVDTLSETIGQIGQSVLMSLEDMMVGAEDQAAPGVAVPADAENDPTLAAELGERKRLLARAIDALPDREKLVVGLYYNEGLTLKEIAEVLGVTESRACQLHSKAMLRLHGKLARHAELMLAA